MSWHWKKKAIQEGRVCRRCKQPQSLVNWAKMPDELCSDCQYGLIGLNDLKTGYNPARDNREWSELSQEDFS